MPRELAVLSNQSFELDCKKFAPDEKLDRLAIYLRIHDVSIKSAKILLVRMITNRKKLTGPSAY